MSRIRSYFRKGGAEHVRESDVLGDNMSTISLSLGSWSGEGAQSGRGA